MKKTSNSPLWTESAEENVEQDDSMEKPEENNEPDSYVSCYPNTRRYSLANAMATNRPTYRTDNQGYSVDLGVDDDDDEREKLDKDTRISIPSGQPPQYSTAVHEKTADKKVKVCRGYNVLRDSTKVLIISGVEFPCRVSNLNISY